jgi:Protein of unknown function (DUF4089)
VVGKPVPHKGKITRRNGTPAGTKRRKKPEALAAIVAAGSKAMALPIEPAWKATIKLNLHLLFTHAGLVDEFSLPDDSEPAPVFRA